MTSYNKSSVEPQPLVKEDLTLVRKGLTRRPQNTLADFRVRSTSYGLEIEFSQDRLRDSPMFTTKKSKADEPGLSLLMVAVTVLLVGGSVALTQSTVFGILVAIAIPAFWRLSASSDAHCVSSTATLRFVNTPRNQTFLSLTTTLTQRKTSLHGTQFQRVAQPHVAHPQNIEQGQSIEQGKSIEPIQAVKQAASASTTIHFSNLPVQLVSARTYFIGGQLSLTLYTSDSQGKNKLRIKGTRQEVQWLHSHIDRWAKATLPHPIT